MTLSKEEQLYRIANHIASAKGGLPDEWQPWADEIESDLRRLVSQERDKQEPVAWLRESALENIHEGAWTPIIQMERDRMGVDLTESWGVSYIPLYTAPQSFGNSEQLNSPVTPDCWCRTCRPVNMADMRFIVCPDCGNKRCPRANDCRNVCSGSNEPGQEGSAYPAAPKQESE